MRVTNILCQVNYHRLTKKLWKKNTRMQIQDLGIPPELQEMGVDIKNATDILNETKLFKPRMKESKPIIKPPSVFQRNKYIYLMNNKVKVSENENQTLALTKTLAYENLPESINRLINVNALDNQDELVQTSALQALVWDAIQDKLPKKVDVTRPGWIFRREYGIRYKKKSSSLLDKFSFLCDAATGNYTESLLRNKILDAYSEIHMKKGNDEVLFQFPCDILMTSPKALPCVASPREVAETETKAVPNIYPIKPTLDLIQLEEYPQASKQSSNQFVSDHLHTLLIAHKSFGFWFPKQLLARAIATCFSFAAVEAQKKYGSDVKELPEPICVQCVYMDVKSFNFLVYQLNTLEVSHDDGIKNQVWVDEPANLYSEIYEESALKDYNRTIFPKMLAFYMNGLEIPCI